MSIAGLQRFSEQNVEKVLTKVFFSLRIKLLKYAHRLKGTL